MFAARGFTAVTMADVVDHSAFDRQYAFDAYAQAYLKPIWQTGAPRWCWLLATTRRASTGPPPTRILTAVMAESAG